MDHLFVLLADGRVEQVRRAIEAIPAGIPGDKMVTLLVEPQQWPAVRSLLSGWDARAGVSETIGWNRLDVGIVQAERAGARSWPGESTEFGELVSASFFGLLASSTVAEIARARLSAVLVQPGGLETLTEAGVWLRHNAQWEPAARELGIHRHSLKARMSRLAAATGLDLDQFQDRAELWALLSSINRLRIFGITGVVIGVVFIIIGWTNRAKSIEKLRALEVEHGVGAGIQER